MQNSSESTIIPEIVQDIQLQNSTLTLYPFQLRDDRDLEEGKLADSALHLWQRINDLGQQLNISKIANFSTFLIPPTEENPESPYEKLLKQADVNNNEISGCNNPLEVIISPVRFHDTYSADITVSHLAPLSIRQLHQLHPHSCFSPQFIQPSLGQTLLFYTCPVIDLSLPSEEDTLDLLAQQCHEILLPHNLDIQPQFIAKGVLFGSPIYEYDNRATDPKQRYHILIWLDRHPQTLDLLTGDVNHYLHRLFLYRHKTLFSYHRSRLWYQEGKKIASQLDVQSGKFTEIDNCDDANQRLTQLKAFLAKTRRLGFSYRRCVRDVTESINTIATNTENYSQFLAYLQERKILGDDLSFLGDFVQISQTQYQGQVAVDLKYLQASEPFFQEMIATIRGRLEIEQIEADRKHNQQESISSRDLNITIGVVGGGMAAASVIATSYALTTDNPVLMPWDAEATTVHPFVHSVGWSLLFGALPLWIWLAILNRRKKKEQDESDRQNPR